MFLRVLRRLLANIWAVSTKQVIIIGDNMLLPPSGWKKIVLIILIQSAVLLSPPVVSPCIWRTKATWRLRCLRRPPKAIRAWAAWGHRRPWQPTSRSSVYCRTFRRGSTPRSSSSLRCRLRDSASSTPRALSLFDRRTGMTTGFCSLTVLHWQDSSLLVLVVFVIGGTDDLWGSIVKVKCQWAESKEEPSGKTRKYGNRNKWSS